MVLRPPNSIFRRVLAGQLVLKAEDFLPKKTSMGRARPRFSPGRTAKLRAKLMEAGINPESVGLPPLPPVDTAIQIPPEITYSDACHEVKCRIFVLGAG